MWQNYVINRFFSHVPPISQVGDDVPHLITDEDGKMSSDGNALYITNICGLYEMQKLGFFTYIWDMLLCMADPM